MLSSILENVLNRGLPRSPRARALCAELAGQRLAVEVPGVARVVLESTGLTLKVSQDASGEVQAGLSGGPLTLLALASAGAGAAVQRDGVRLSGDAELAQKFHELTALLRPDLEEELALVIGDVPAYQIGRLARASLQWGRRAAATAVRNLAEYLAHERGDAVSRGEGRQLLEGVDAVRDAAERAEARLALLEQAARARQSRGV